MITSKGKPRTETKNDRYSWGYTTEKSVANVTLIVTWPLAVAWWIGMPS